MLFMLLFFLLIFILYKKSVTGALALFVAGSFLAGFLISLKVEIKDINDMINIGVTIFILFFFIYGFKNYKIYNLVDDGKKEKLLRIFNVIFIGSILALIANVIILILLFDYYLQMMVSVEHFKNLKIAQEYLLTSVPTPLSIFSTLLTPLSYLALGYHFYFLIVNDKYRAILALIASTNMFIVPLFVMGRGGLVIYVLIYIFYLIYVYTAIKKFNKKKFLIFLLRMLFIVGIPFYYITKDRFSDFLYETVDPLITDPLLYSLFIYFSMWIKNGLLLLSKYSLDLNLAASSFRYLPNRFLQSLGQTTPSIQELRTEAFGDLANSFNGLPALMVYDFGYLGAMVFSILFSLFVIKIGPKKGEITPFKLLYFSVLIPVPLLFFQGSYFIFSSYNIALVYTFIFSLIYRIKFR